MATDAEIEAGLAEIEKLFEAGEHAQILVLTERLLGLNPSPPLAASLHRCRARAYTLLGNWEQAAQAWTKVLTHIPEVTEPHTETPVTEQDHFSISRRAAWERATASFGRPSETVVGARSCWTMRTYVPCTIGANGCNLKFEKGKTDPACNLAEVECTRAITLNPNDPLAYCSRAGIYHCRRKWDAAREDCCRAIELDPACVPAYSLRASVHNNLNRLAEAIADWTHVIGLNPADAVAYKLRGFAYEELGDETKAASDHLRAFELDRGMPVPG